MSFQTVILGTQFFAEEKRLTKTGRLKQGGLNKLNICTISLKRQKKPLLKLSINAHLQRHLTYRITYPRWQA